MTRSGVRRTQVASLRASAKKSEVGELRDSVSELKSRVKSLEEKLKIAGMIGASLDRGASARDRARHGGSKRHRRRVHAA